MPEAPLAGTEGKDYHFVNYGGVIYVVYSVKLPNGKVTRISWKVRKDDYDALHVDPKNVQRITSKQFQELQYFGDSKDIQDRPSDEHPLTSYFQDLRSTFGAKVSWLNDKEYMGTMMMGFLENWDSGQLTTKLQQTQWYQSRNDAQRAWELTTNKAQRKVTIDNTSAQITTALQDLYGTISFQEAGIKGSDIAKWAKSIASGDFGDPSTGFNVWLQDQRDKAEKVEGSAAWQDKQSTEEAQRKFMNRPEDMFQKIKTASLKKAVQLRIRIRRAERESQFCSEFPCSPKMMGLRVCPWL